MIVFTYICSILCCLISCCMILSYISIPCDIQWRKNRWLHVATSPNSANPFPRTKKYRVLYFKSVLFQEPVLIGEGDRSQSNFPVSHVSKPCAIPAEPRFPMFVAVLVACLVVIYISRLGLALWFDGFDLQILAGSTPSMLFVPRRNTILWFLERIFLCVLFGSTTIAAKNDLSPPWFTVTPPVREPLFLAPKPRVRLNCLSPGYCKPHVNGAAITCLGEFCLMSWLVQASMLVG